MSDKKMVWCNRAIFILMFQLFILYPSLWAEGAYNVRRVDLLSRYGLAVNGAGPLLVKTDETRNRIILVHTNTSALTIIDGQNQGVTNIPFKTRVPQYLKSEALTIDSATGNIYVIGNKCLHIVFPQKKDSTSINTTEQYEMVAVDEKTGNAFLVGRGSQYLAKVNMTTHHVTRLKWVDFTEPMVNLNQTPPPPIRKVVCDSTLNRLAVIDGYTSTLYLYSTRSGQLIAKRILPTKGGKRWHLTGYNSTTHHLYLVIETEKREAINALKIDLVLTQDTVVELPGLTEPVGVTYNPKRDEIYIPYDNHPSVHVVDFKLLPENEKTGRLTEIKVPAYGNDATALDENNNRLYVASWAYGEVAVINLISRTLSKRILNTGIIPHMFNMTFNSHTGKLYIPVGASAVNGSFGAALDVLDPETEKLGKIHTGWAPIALVEAPEHDGFYVFNSEDEAALVNADGTVTYYPLPCRFINQAIPTGSGNIYVAYGPHQSYWPVVYIWGAKNGILGFDPKNKTFYDRRIPRMAQQMVLDKNGVCYALQNNWGDEKQFLITLPDEVRQPNLGQDQITFEDKVIRETTQRLLKYDEKKHWLYIVRVGETNHEPGIIQIYDLTTKKILFKSPVGLTPADLVFDETTIYIANFDDNNITLIDKNNFSIKNMATDAKPFKLTQLNGTLYCLNHNGNTLQAFVNGTNTGTWPVPGQPANLFATDTRLFMTSHTPDALTILVFEPDKKTMTTIHKESYPYGETTLDTDNTSFFMRGQLADGIFQANQLARDKEGRIWITDYLAGKVFIIR